MAEVNMTEDLLQPVANTTEDLLAPAKPAVTKPVVTSNLREAAFAVLGEGNSDPSYHLAKLEEVEAEINSYGDSSLISQYKNIAKQSVESRKRQQVENILRLDIPASEMAVRIAKELKKNPQPLTAEGYYKEELKAANPSDMFEAMQNLKEEDTTLRVKDVEEDMLFAKAARQFYKVRHKEDFTGSDKDAIKFGMQYIRQVNVQPEELVRLPFLLDNESDDALAFLYMATVMDAMEYTFEGFAKNVGEFASSPTNLATTILTMGAGTIVKQGAQKGTARFMLGEIMEKYVAKMATKKGMAAAGGVQAGAFNLAIQDAEIEAGLRKDVSLTEAGTATATGMGIGLGLGIVAEKGGKALTHWLKKKSPAQITSEVNPAAGRELAKQNIDTGTPLAGEAAEETLKRHTPKAANEPITPSASITSEYDRLVESHPILAHVLTEEEKNLAKKGYMAGWIKSLGSLNRVVREDKSTVELVGDKLKASIAIGKTPDTGYTSLKEVEEELLKIKEEISLAHTSGVDFEVISRSGQGGTFSQLTTSELKEKLATGQEHTGEYFIRVSASSFLEENPTLVGLWTKEMNSGLGRTLSWLQYGPQRGMRFFSPRVSAVSQQAFFKNILMQGVTELRRLPISSQMNVLRRLRQDEGVGFMKPNDANAFFPTKAEADVYNSYVDQTKIIRTLFDHNLSLQLQKEGWKRLSFTTNAVGDHSVIAKPVRFKDLEGKELIDLESGQVIKKSQLKNIINPSNQKLEPDEVAKRLSELQFIKFYEAVPDKNNVKAAHQYGVLAKDTTVKHDFVTTVLHETPGYIPGIRRALYIIHHKTDGFLINGVPTAKGLHEDVAGQKSITVGFANSEYDARKHIEKLEKDFGTGTLEYSLSREASDIGFAAAAGLGVRQQGVIYGARAKVPPAVYKGAGELKDIGESFEYLADRAASMMTSGRVDKFQKEQFVNTFLSDAGKKGQRVSFPETIEEFEIALAKTLVRDREKYAEAKDAWNGIQSQKRFYENSVRKKFEQIAIWASDMLSDSKYTSGLARIVGKQVVEKVSPTQAVRNAAFYTQIVVGFGQLVLNAANIATNATFALVRSPKVFSKAMGDIAGHINGTDKVFTSQLKRSGILGTVDQHDLQATVVSMKTRQDLDVKKLSLLKKGKTHAVAALQKAGKGVRKATFNAPEQANKTVAFAVARRLYMQSKGIEDASTLLDGDAKAFNEIIAWTETLTQSMNQAGRLPVSGMPFLDLITQYKAYGYKQTALLMSGVPVLSSAGMAQKVIPKEEIQKLLITYGALFGFSGLGLKEPWDYAREELGIDKDSWLDLFVSGGMVSVAYNGVLAGIDDDGKVAAGERLSPTSGSGIDFFVQWYKTFTDFFGSDRDMADKWDKVAPSFSMIKGAYNAVSITGSLMFNDAIEESLEADERVLLAAIELSKVTTGGRAINKTMVAYNTGMLFDRYGKPVIGGVTKGEALSLLYGAQPVDVSELYRTQKAVSEMLEKGGMKESEIQQIASDHFDRMDYVVNMAISSNMSIDDTMLHLRAAELLTDLGYGPNIDHKVREAYKSLIVRKDMNERVNKLRDKINMLLFKSEYTEETINIIKAAPPALFSDEEKRNLVYYIEQKHKEYQ